MDQAKLNTRTTACVSTLSSATHATEPDALKFDLFENQQATGELLAATTSLAMPGLIMNLANWFTALSASTATQALSTPNAKLSGRRSRSERSGWSALLDFWVGMKKKDVQELKHGLYRIHWKSGGSSLASVGSMPDGARWMAPTNWVSGSSASRDVWRAVESVDLLADATR